MTPSLGFENTPEQASTLRDILTGHTVDYLRTGVYRTWIEVVSKYCTEQNDSLQSELDDFSRSELPLAAITLHNKDRIYPGYNSHFLIKVDPDTGVRGRASRAPWCGSAVAASPTASLTNPSAVVLFRSSGF